MSLRFILNGSNRVDTTTNVAVMPDVCTMLAWIFPTTIDATYQAVVEKTPIGYADYRGFGINGTTGEVAAFMRRGSPGYTGAEVAKTGILKANKWQFVGVQMDGTSASATDQKIFFATEQTLPSEVYSYNTQTAGSGSTSPDSGATMVIGNNAGSSYAEGFPGLIHSLAIWNRKMDIAEIRYWKRMMQAGKFRPSGGNTFFMYLGRNTGTQRDLSGNNYNGTITGAITVAAAPAVAERFFPPLGASAAGGATAYTQNLGGGFTPAGVVTMASAKGVGGSMTPAGALAAAAALFRSGSITPTGSAIEAVSVTRSGTLTPSGVLSRVTAFFRPLTGSITPTGSATEAVSLTRTGAVTPASSLETLKVVLQAVAGAVTPTGAIAKAISAAKAGNLVPAGVVVKTATRSLAGSITPAAALETLKVFLKAIAGSVTPTGAIAKAVSATKAGSVTPSGSSRSVVAKLFAGLITPAGTLEALKVVMLSLAGTIAPTGSLQRTIAKQLAGALAPAGSLAKSIAKTISGAIAAAGNLITNWITPEGKADISVTVRALTNISVSMRSVTSLDVTAASVNGITVRAFTR